MQFRSCGDCTACCDGNIIGNSYGNSFGFHKPCVFLVSKLCTIYKDRPTTCCNYQCGWTQGILPEWMKPNKCGVLVSVENDKQSGIQFLRVVEITQNVDEAVYENLDSFCKKNNTYYIKVTYEANSRDPRL